MDSTEETWACPACGLPDEELPVGHCLGLPVDGSAPACSVIALPQRPVRVPGGKVVVQDGWPYFDPDGISPDPADEPAWAAIGPSAGGAVTIRLENGDGAMGQFLHSMLGGSPPEPGPPYVHTFAAPEPVTLTSGDPEPPPGTVVCDKYGVTWERYGKGDGGYWTYARDDDDGHMHPERWAGIAGERGPVTVLEEPGPAYTLTEDH